MSEELILNFGEQQLVRQWFNAVQDLNRDYLELPDYELAKKVYETLGMRVPDSISANAGPI